MSESVKVNRVYRYRVYPTVEQEAALERWLGMCRVLYNKALWWKQGTWERRGERVTFKEQTHALVELKRDFSEYRELPPSILEDVLKRVDLAYKAFFRRCRTGEKVGYPRSKGEGWYKSLSINRAREFDLKPPRGGERYGKLLIGRAQARRAALGPMRIRMHRNIPEGANVRRVMLKREANGHWYALVGWDMEVERESVERDAVGLDVGLSAFITTSSGDEVQPPKNYKRLQKKLRRKQRVLSRRKRGSNGRKRARREVAKVHAKIRNRRRDFLHNVSRKVVDEYGLIAVEDLRINNMVKNRHLAGSILDAGWGEFASMLAYKAESAGTSVVFVDPRNTSQLCSGCGQVVKKALSVRTHRCECGLVLDRDHNAAINILYRGAQLQRELT